eukprot:827723-Rhodomonas_salina.1
MRGVSIGMSKARAACTDEGADEVRLDARCQLVDRSICVDGVLRVQPHPSCAASRHAHEQLLRVKHRRYSRLFFSLSRAPIPTSIHFHILARTCAFGGFPFKLSPAPASSQYSLLPTPATPHALPMICFRNPAPIPQNLCESLSSKSPGTSLDFLYVLQGLSFLSVTTRQFMQTAITTTLQDHHLRSSAPHLTPRSTALDPKSIPRPRAAASDDEEERMRSVKTFARDRSSLLSFTLWRSRKRSREGEVRLTNKQSSLSEQINDKLGT